MFLFLDKILGRERSKSRKSVLENNILGRVRTQ